MLHFLMKQAKVLMQKICAIPMLWAAFKGKVKFCFVGTWLSRFKMILLWHRIRVRGKVFDADMLFMLSFVTSLDCICIVSLSLGTLMPWPIILTCYLGLIICNTLNWINGFVYTSWSSRRTILPISWHSFGVLVVYT